MAMAKVGRAKKVRKYGSADVLSRAGVAMKVIEDFLFEPLPHRVRLYLIDYDNHAMYLEGDGKTYVLDMDANSIYRLIEYLDSMLSNNDMREYTEDGKLIFVYLNGGHNNVKPEDVIPLLRNDGVVEIEDLNGHQIKNFVYAYADKYNNYDVRYYKVVVVETKREPPILHLINLIELEEHPV